MTITHPAADTHPAEIDTATDRTRQPSIEPAPNAAREPSPPRRGRSSLRVAVGWIAVVLAVAGLAVLTYAFVADDAAAPAPSGPVGDPKDRIGYRSPTIQRELTTGDAKDHAPYRPALTTWEYTTGDAKDHAPYRPPLTTWEYTTGDAKDHAGYRSPYDTP
jgi:hypothetical protein